MYTFTGKMLRVWIQLKNENKFTKLFNFPFNTFYHFQSTQKCIHYYIWPKILWYNKHKYLRMFCLFVCLFSFSFLQWSENQLISVFLFTFIFYTLFVFFSLLLKKVNISHEQRLTQAHVMYSQMAQFPVYIQLWTLFWTTIEFLHSMLPLWHLMHSNKYVVLVNTE